MRCNVVEAKLITLHSQKFFLSKLISTKIKTLYYSGVDMTDNLGDRMKENENIFRQYLPKRCYTILRLDGCHFHTFTRGMKKPFDERLVNGMIETTKYLCSHIQGCKLGYVQSDEISLVLTDFENIKSDAWFSGNIQKIVSVSSSMASTFLYSYLIHSTDLYFQEKDIFDIPTFDCRVWSLSDIWEVYNAFLWRQQDCTRNSIESIAHSLYSQKQCQNKNCNELQEMIFQKGTNFNNVATHLKRGTFVYKTNTLIEGKAIDDFGNSISTGVEEQSKSWYIDKECPKLTEDKKYFFDKVPVLNKDFGI